MGEDESGDLKTPLKQGSLLKFIQCAFRNLILEMTFQMKANNSTNIKTCVKRRVFLLLLGDLSETCEKGKEKKFEKEPKRERKRGLKQKKIRERRQENKEKVKTKEREGIGQPIKRLRDEQN